VRGYPAMSKARVNTILVVVACVVYIVFALLTGWTNGGLGPEGSVYTPMVVNHDLRAGSAVDKLSPAFPFAAAVVYAAAGNLMFSFLFVNLVAFAVLMWAMCWILDLQSAPSNVKLYATITLLLLGIPTRMSAFVPGQPLLLGVAALSLAIAAAEWSCGLLTAIFQVAAVLASPVGIAAPLYGIWKNWRRDRRTTLVVVFVPALLVWLLVQYWARGGASGLVDLIRFSRVRADATFWTESLFVLFGLHFLVTAFGGLSVLLSAQPRWIRDAVSRQPELLALLLPVVLFIVTAGLSVPPTIAFLLPLWFLVVGMWTHEHAASITAPLVLATVITVLTQHPWARLTDTTYFVDWFPYSVYAGRVNVSDPNFDALWRVRGLIAAGSLAACAAWRRSHAR
jgi:hypothetical protein